MLIPLASRCMFTSYTAAILSTPTFTLAAAPFGFDVYVHFLCSSKIRAILRFLGSSIPWLPGEFTPTMQQQFHLHIDYKAAAASPVLYTFWQQQQFGSSSKSIFFLFIYIPIYYNTLSPLNQ